MTFHVGQKVVCVDECPPEYRLQHEDIVFPVKGAVYTIRDTMFEGGKAWVRLVEIVNKPQQYDDGWDECDFWAGHFRPAVQPRKELPESITKYLNVPGRVDA